MMINQFIKNPIKVSIINATNNTTKEIYVFLGNVKQEIVKECNNIESKGIKKSPLLEEFYGKFYKAKLAIDIDAPKKYITFPIIYPIDDFETIRDKIYLATNVPTYRQHIMYFDNERAKTTYDIELRGLNININIMNSNKKSNTFLFDIIPIDGRFRVINSYNGNYEENYGREYDGGDDLVSEITPEEFRLDLPDNMLDNFEDKVGNDLVDLEKEKENNPEEIKQEENKQEENNKEESPQPNNESRKESRIDVNAIVEPLDGFKLIGLEHIDNSMIYVADIADFIKPEFRTKILEDVYYLNLIYAGFVVKYFPRFTLDAFKEYLINENTFREYYSELSINKIVLQSKYEAEEIELNYAYKNAQAIETWSNSNIKVYLTKITAIIQAPTMLLNIRNIFDLLGTDSNIAEIRAKVQHKGRQYMLKKNRINGSAIKFPSEYEFSNDLIIAMRHSGRQSKQGKGKGINNKEKNYDNQKEKNYDNQKESIRDVSIKEKYFFICVRSNARISISCEWNEQDDIDIKGATSLIVKNTNIIIEMINKLGKYAFVSGMRLSNIDQSNVVLQKVESFILWKKSMSNFAYKLFTKKIEELLVSGIIILKQATKTERVEEYLLSKGAFNFDRTLMPRILDRINLDIPNLYVYFSNPTINKKWKQIYRGRDLYISHKTTSIEFKVNSIGQDEYDIFYFILTSFLHKINKNTEFAEQINSSATFYKARKLRQEDPVLYDLSRYSNTKDKMYSRLCQQIKQPTIYTEEESKEINPKKLTKYWNFTTNKPAYYACDNKHFPDMSFIVDKHPLGYCMPCCTKKLKIREDSLKNQRNIACLTHHKYIAEEKSSKHVGEFGKNIDDRRLANLPNVLTRLFYNASSIPLYAYGVNQYYNNIYAPILYIAKIILKMPIKEILEKILTLLSNKKIFSMLVEGEITAYFLSPTELATVFTEIFIIGRMANNEFRRWNFLLTELIAITFSIQFSIFKVSPTPNNQEDKYANIKLQQIKPSVMANPEADIRYSLLIEYTSNDPRLYPIFSIDRHEYNTKGILSSVIFDKNELIISRIFAMLGEKKTYKFNGYSLVAQYVNKSGLCYALIFASKKNNAAKVYVPVDYITVEPNIKSIYDAFDPIGFNLGDLIEFLGDKLIRFISYDGRIIGAISSLGAHYCEGAIDAQTNIKSIEAAQLIHYNPQDVNKAIIANLAPNDKQIKSSLGQAIYTNYEYRLFVMEFANYIDKEQNIELRKKLYKIIESADLSKPIKFIKRQIKEIVSPETYIILVNQLYKAYYKKFNKDQLISQIKNTIYDFDRTLIKKLMNMSHHELIGELKRISFEFAIEGEIPANSQFPNIYMTCESAIENTPYCDKNKLIVSNLNGLISFLAKDLKNELKAKYFLTDIWIDNYIDYFTFRCDPFEKVSIYSS